jgi:predicted transcriptional regulator
MHLQFAQSVRYEVRKKRTELGQLIQILEHLGSSGETIITSLARHANMSHCLAAQNCEKLICAGLIEKTVSDNNKKYRLTSEGRSFLNYCRNFEDVLRTYKLNNLLCH